MGRITSSVGLITGLPIQDTVDQLMKIEARSRDLITVRQTVATAEQSALTELTALALGLSFSSASLANESLYQARSVTSSNDAALSALAVGNPPLGSFQYTPLRTAQSHQLLSSSFASRTAAVGEGTIRFRFGKHVAEGLDLKLTNGGAGFTRGKIRLTDRSGETAVIDLTRATSIDDVLAAINGQTDANITAEAVGDRIRLTDHTGQTASNLKVQEVGGTTATSLGLEGIDAASATADGDDLVRLATGLDVNALNDGNGLRIADGAADIRFSFRDGTTAVLDLDPDDVQTLGDVLDAINALSPAKLSAAISADRERIELTDLTTDDGETFTVEAIGDSGLAADLGLLVDASGDTLSGRRLLGGLQGALLASLDGGGGLGALGEIDLTDRSGASATVDLADAETLDDVVRAINVAGLAITARVNDAQNGLLLTDDSGSTASDLIVANGDATNTADALGIAVADAVTQVNSGDLHLRVVSENTLLSRLNGGAGVDRGVLRITTSNGASRTLNLSNASIQTVGDVLDAVNDLGIGVEARINDTGDGIALIDSSGGSGNLLVSDVSGTSAADLRLAGSGQDQEIDGDDVKVIDGSFTYVIETDADDTLEDLIAKFNDLDAGVSASLFNDGSTLNPFRFSLLSERSGRAGALVLDASQAGFSLAETVAAQDALLLFGSAANASAGVLISSSTNTFADVLPGARLTVRAASEQPVTIRVAASDEKLAAAAQEFVDDFNSLITRLRDLTKFDTTSNKRSILTGDATSLRVETDLSQLVSGRILGAGELQALESVGIGLDGQGKLTLDSDKLSQAFADDPDAVREFFTAEETGFAARIKRVLDRLAGDENSALTLRLDALEDRIQDYGGRIALLNTLLERKRERYLRAFQNAELAIGKLQANLSALASIQPLAPLTSS